MAPQSGACIIGREGWATYQLPVLRAMGATAVKIQVGDPDAGFGRPWYTTDELDQLLTLLPANGTLLLRLPETRIGPGELDALWHTALPNGPQSLLQWVAALPQGAGARRVVVEVGNEPDRADLDAWEYRSRLLQAAPALRAFLPAGVELCASLPTTRGRPGTDQAGMQYARIVLDVDQPARPVLDAYDSLGVHGYGTLSFSRDEADAWAMFDLAAATGKPLWWTEAGIDAPQPWAIKAREYRRFLDSLPDQVRGVTFFALSLDPAWRHYAIDLDDDGALDPGLAGAHLLA